MKNNSKIFWIALSFILLLITYCEYEKVPEQSLEVVRVNGSKLSSLSDLLDTSIVFVDSVELQAGTDVSDYVPKSIKFIQVHCTASPGELTKQWILWFFKNERGWSRPGYNYLVHRDGRISTLQKINFDPFVQHSEISYGVRGRNSESINIAYTGGVDLEGRPADNRTPQQAASLALLVQVLHEIAPNAVIQGHRDNPNVAKACPSFDVAEEFQPIEDFWDLKARALNYRDFSESFDVPTDSTFLEFM